ncbi:hypothetical protein GCM10009554_00410 [Kribbella koreensis]|uniref:Uncharacterized protein n=1 Tax=Kribbella koreensis TaxID=57909 RepID=A0ABP3ZIJ4_9ACTN
MTSTAHTSSGVARRTVLAAIPAMTAALAITTAGSAGAAPAAVPAKRPQCLADLVAAPTAGGDR